MPNQAPKSYIMSNFVDYTSTLSADTYITESQLSSFCEEVYSSYFQEQTEQFELNLTNFLSSQSPIINVTPDEIDDFVIQVFD